MKQKLLNLLTVFLGFIGSAAFFVGVFERSNIVRSILGVLFVLICVCLWMHTLELGYDVLTTYVKIKKKKKTNEIEIRLQVKFIAKDLPNTTWNKTFISNKNLTYCVSHAMSYAKLHDCLIDEMNLLTTED